MVHKIPTIPELINVIEMAKGKMAKKIGKETSSKGICFHCGQYGHWKRNCKAYLESKKKVACATSTPSGIYVNEVNTVSYGNLWVLDTGCGSHIYVLICRALGTAGSSQRESPTFGWVMVQELWLFPLGLMF